MGGGFGGFLWGGGGGEKKGGAPPPPPPPESKWEKPGHVQYHKRTFFDIFYIGCSFLTAMHGLNLCDSTRYMNSCSSNL